MNGQFISLVSGLITLFIERVGDERLVKWLFGSWAEPREPFPLKWALQAAACALAQVWLCSPALFSCLDSIACSQWTTFKKDYLL